MTEQKISNKEILQKWKYDPFTFIFDIWGLVPQKVLPEYEEFYFDVLKRAKKDCEIMDDLKNFMFESFEKGKNITWQQALIIQAVKDGINGLRPRNISIKTGHGIGKSNIISKIGIWFLFCFYESKIGLTAPDAQTLYDSLFSEVGKSLNQMLEPKIASAFKKTEDYLVVNGAEDSWYARCKTGKKENPEALAGLHADNIMLIADEASGVPDAIYESGESNLTGTVSFFILIGNPLRNIGVFYDSFGNPNFQNLHFNGEESPITGDYPKKIKEEYGEDSDIYRRRVLALFPREDLIDGRGYVQLITSDKIKQEANLKLYGDRKILGVDCAGTGKDLTTWVLRDNLGAVIVGHEQISDAKSIAIKTITIMKEYGVNPGDVFIDNFGVGANVGVEMAILGYKVSPIYVGEVKINNNDIVENGQKILNVRALLFWRCKKWLEAGGILGINEAWKELQTIRYRRTEKDQIQIMSKQDMKKLGFGSPDYADALSLTFYPGELLETQKKKFYKSFTPNYEDYI